MTYFDKAVMNLLNLEGLYVDHGSDRGGATNYGISLRFLENLPPEAGDINNDGHVDKRDIKALSPHKAIHFYRKYFWSHYKLHRLKNYEVASKALDLFVNMRGKTAALIHQRAANELGSDLTEDGIMGPHSINAINSHDPAHYLVCVRYHAWLIYKAIIQRDPTQAVFRKGWQNRAFS